MNELSWMIYAADVAGVLGIGAGISALSIALAGGVVGAMLRVEGDESEKVIGKRLHKWTLILVSPLLLVATFTPSSETIYAIAASEMGEEIIKSETAGKAMKPLDAWLDRQIAPESK